MRNWFYIGVTIVLTAVVLVVWETPPELLLPGEREDRAEAQLFSVITDAQARHFNEQGDISYAFTAEEVRHYRYNVAQVSNADYTEIAQPEFTLYTENPPWHMRASRGRLTDEGLTLTLLNKVHIWQMNQEDRNQRASELTTEKLTVRPVEKTAHTDAPVTIDTPVGTVSAEGMNADLRSHRIEFLSNVQGTYDAM